MTFKCPKPGCKYELRTHEYSSKNPPVCPEHKVKLVDVTVREPGLPYIPKAKLQDGGKVK